ncbi:amidohydrolase family protein [Haliea sp.]|uniref:amidohydrolase family protein n=1 Tax=Haliea sp. TaxID=1932666 RepID=UPI0025C0208D|nr:amidohydrolase family protein [Haliea sp.]|tara:strand:- start:2393 stop:4003 length:1611 start_codon:yes stop_codon:yes gene_type:complete
MKHTHIRPEFHTRICGAVLLTLLFCMTLAGRPLAAGEARHDLVIIGGRVVDPESGLDAVRNLGITGSEIVEISEGRLVGKRTIDASGLIVAPGFIDLHSHGQSLVADRMHAYDGVTTTLELESGVLPVDEWYQSQARAGRALNYGTSAAWTFARIAEFEGLTPRAEVQWFRDAFARKRWVSEAASSEQVQRITAYLEQGLRDGALGIGINGGYAPGGGFRELLAVHSLAARHEVPTFTHISCDNPQDPDSSAECVGQVIALAASTGNPAHICHLNSSSVRAVDVTAGMIQSARASGVPITTEAYTYGAASTTIGSALFSPDAMAAKGVKAQDIEYNGQRLNEESFKALRAEQPGAIIVKHFLDLPAERSVLDTSVLLPGGAIASDSMPWIDANTGALIPHDVWPLPETAYAHPRSAGTFSRLLAEWVRESESLSLTEALRKTSLIPATILQPSVPQMRKKGRLQVGMDADIVIFDLNAVQDRATFANPRQPSVGMRYVLVNGVPVIDEGELRLDSMPGRAIRRPPQDTITDMQQGH